MTGKLRYMLVRYLGRIIVLMFAVILFSMVFLQTRLVVDETNVKARQIISQVEKILEKNESELNEVKKNYTNRCLASADTVAYIMNNNPWILKNRDIAELFKIAKLVQVDEIHIFDEKGVIVFGTQPHYYGLSIFSGEQISFFKPMLEDKSLRMVQGIEGNTAEGKLVQYSAIWSLDGEFIVQVGMYPDAVLQAKSKNELSYIFSLLQANASGDLYAIDRSSGEILGCTNSSLIGKRQYQVGISLDLRKKQNKGFFVTVNGIQSYAMFKSKNNLLIGYVVPRELMFRNIFETCALFALGLFIIVLIVVVTVGHYLAKYIIREIYSINNDLRKITSGDLNVKVKANNSSELVELSSGINQMVSSLLKSQEQIKKERDMDLLTGLLNRRGMDHALRDIQKNGKEEIGWSAMLMIDADGLKTINDAYGHEGGDSYLCKIANVLQSVEGRKSICARQGGDEFILYLYGYENEKLLDAVIKNLKALQNGQTAVLANGKTVDLAFSVGVSKANGIPDYFKMFKEADQKMYANKRRRKSKR